MHACRTHARTHTHTYIHTHTRRLLQTVVCSSSDVKLCTHFLKVYKHISNDFAFVCFQENSVNQDLVEQMYRRNPILRYTQHPLHSPLLPLPYGEVPICEYTFTSADQLLNMRTVNGGDRRLVIVTVSNLDQCHRQVLFFSSL